MARKLRQHTRRASSGLPLHRGKIDGIAVTATDCDNQYDHFRITHFVDESVADAAQLDLVAIRMAMRSARRERLRPGLERQTSLPPVLTAQDVDLLNAVKRLPPRQRAAVALFYFEDRPLSEVANIMGCSHAAAKVHVFNARRRLADLLGEEALDGSRG